MLNIFTLSWNASDKLVKLKESLMPALEGIDYTWFIKDNASNDDTFDQASSWGNNVKVFRYKDNIQNFSEGMNYLFAQAAPNDNDQVLLLNNDIIFNDTTSIKNMSNILSNDDSVGAVGSRLLYTGTDKIQHGGVVFHNNHQTPTHFRLNEKTDSNAENNRLFQVVTGAVLLTKAEYFKNVCTSNKSGVNGFDEKFRWAFDDVDFCLSIKYNMNKNIVYCGANNIFHEESASLKKNPANQLFMSHNINYLKSKWLNTYKLDRDVYMKNTKHNLYRNPNE